MTDTTEEGLVAFLRERAEGRSAPLIVALDGRSGTGKSTLAATVAREIGACVIDSDDFYAGLGEEAWDAMSPEEKADGCIDWRPLRDVIAALAAGRSAAWYAYDWDTDDGRQLEHPMACEPAPVVIVEGTYSGRVELADLVDVRVLCVAPDSVRRDRLMVRDGEAYLADWARWNEAEDWYFEHVVRPESFDRTVRYGS